MVTQISQELFLPDKWHQQWDKCMAQWDKCMAQWDKCMAKQQTKKQTTVARCLLVYTYDNVLLKVSVVQ